MQHATNRFSVALEIKYNWCLNTTKLRLLVVITIYSMSYCRPKYTDTGSYVRVLVACQFVYVLSSDVRQEQWCNDKKTLQKEKNVEGKKRFMHSHTCSDVACERWVAATLTSKPHDSQQRFSCRLILNVTQTISEISPNPALAVFNTRYWAPVFTFYTFRFLICSAMAN